MSDQIQSLVLKHYGISPWEINVITSILDKRFRTEDEEIENTYENKFVSHLEISFPYSLIILGVVPVVLAIVFKFPPLSPAAIKRVTLDLPRVPFTWILIGILLNAF